MLNAHKHQENLKSGTTGDEPLYVQASHARENFSNILNQVAFAGKECVIQRNGKDLAALISMDDLAYFRQLEDWMDIQAAEAVSNEKTISWEKIKSKHKL